MKQKGFTILFAVLVSSIILALGLGIVAITMKEVRLSGTGRDSQLAFYAADSGAECAFYWDLKGDYFSTSTANISEVICNNQQFTNTSDSPAYSWGGGVDSQGVGTTSFTMYMVKGDASKSCAVVSIAKYLEAGNTKTVIDSRGYNTCDVNNQRRLERGYQIRY